MRRRHWLQIEERHWPRYRKPTSPRHRDFQELLARRPRPALKQEINVVGSVLVYCDPKTWPKDPERLNLPEGWFIAVGVHPKHALDFG
jgi:hypothetical protein